MNGTIHRRLLLAGTISLAALFSCPPCLADAAQGEAASQDQASRMRDLERRIAELEAALKQGPDTASRAELERRLDLIAAELEKLRVGDAAKPRELKSMYGLGPAASKVYTQEHGVSVGGYGEALLQDFAATSDDGTRTGEDTNFDFLRAVLYFGYKFNDRIVFNSEIEYEHATTGEGAELKGEISLEFATLDFMTRKEANVRAGLVLLPVGFINEMHEPPTFLGARRPDVERMILPSTWREIGAGGFGDMGPFSWRAYVVNGLDAEGFSGEDGIREGRQDGSEASARDLAFTARADYNGLPGLLVGASFFQGDSGQGAEDAAGDVIDGRVTLYDVHAQYVSHGFQFRALWTSVQVDDAGTINTDLLLLDPNDPLQVTQGVGSRMLGYYGEVGYDVLSALGESSRQALIPFVRLERYNTQDNAAAGFESDGANDVRLTTYGVAYKPISQLSIKLEFQDYDRADGTGTDQINAGIGYLF